MIHNRCACWIKWIEANDLICTSRRLQNADTQLFYLISVGHTWTLFSQCWFSAWLAVYANTTLTRHKRLSSFCSWHCSIYVAINKYWEPPEVVEWFLRPNRCVQEHSRPASIILRTCYCLWVPWCIMVTIQVGKLVAGSCRACTQHVCSHNCRASKKVCSFCLGGVGSHWNWTRSMHNEKLATFLIHQDLSQSFQNAELFLASMAELFHACFLSPCCVRLEVYRKTSLTSSPFDFKIP